MSLRYPLKLFSNGQPVFSHVVAVSNWSTLPTANKVLETAILDIMTCYKVPTIANKLPKWDTLVVYFDGQELTYVPLEGSIPSK